MDSETNDIFQIFIAGIIFMTALLILLLASMIGHLRKRLRTYRQQVKREIELIDKERSRISADLHDELGSGLAAVGLFMRQAAESANSTPLQKALHHLQIQQKKIREISHDLLPRDLETHGLSKALEELYEEIKEAGKIKITIKGSIDNIAVQPAKAIHLYRIIREVLVNAVKHSGASEIIISSQRKGKWLYIQIKDNGIGFSHTSNNPNNKGEGLKNIQSRIDILQGTVTVNAEKNKGTYCQIRIPFKTITIPYGTK